MKDEKKERKRKDEEEYKQPKTDLSYFQNAGVLRFPLSHVNESCLITAEGQLWLPPGPGLCCGRCIDFPVINY